MLPPVGFRFRLESMALDFQDWSGEFPVMALIEAMKGRADWKKNGAVLDGAIAIALVAVVLVASGLMAFGFIQ